MTEMMERTEDMPQTVWEGSFTIFGVEVKCYVLDDGQRIVDAESMAALIEAMDAPLVEELGDIEEFAVWQGGAK